MIHLQGTTLARYGQSGRDVIDGSWAPSARPRVRGPVAQHCRRRRSMRSSSSSSASRVGGRHGLTPANRSATSPADQPGAGADDHAPKFLVGVRVLGKISSATHCPRSGGAGVLLRSSRSKAGMAFIHTRSKVWPDAHVFSGPSPTDLWQSPRGAAPVTDRKALHAYLSAAGRKSPVESPTLSHPRLAPRGKKNVFEPVSLDKGRY